MTLTDDEPVANSELTTDESELLASLETEIGYGINEFNTIGACLYQIKSKKLYRSTHTTFASYCKDKFQISRVHGDRLVSAFETQEFLKSEPIGSVVIPKTESALRAFNNLNISEKKAVGKKLKDEGCNDPTAKDVEAAKAKAVPAKSSKKTFITPKPDSLKLVLQDITETVAMVEQDRPKEDIIAALNKASIFIKDLLKKGAV